MAYKDTEALKIVENEFLLVNELMSYCSEDHESP